MEHQRQNQDREVKVIMSMLKLMDRYSRERREAGELPRSRRALTIHNPPMAKVGVKSDPVAVRVAVGFNVTAICADLKLHGLIRDISTSGLFIETRETPFAVGDKLELEIELPDHESPLHCFATVARVSLEKQRGYGLRFDT